MSSYQFLACDSELPEIPSEGENGVIDLSTLRIIKRNDNMPYKDIAYYTKKKNIYSLEWDYSDDNCEILLEYLQKLNTIRELEIWDIWLCDYYNIHNEIYYNLQKLKTQKNKFDNLTFDLLKSFIERMWL